MLEFPLGGVMKWMLSPTMLYDPLYILAAAELAWFVAAEPTEPLSTLTRGIVPVLVIGPDAATPRPTLTILMYSSSTFNNSSGLTELISLRRNVVAVVEILPFKVLATFVNNKGYCAILSKVIIAFSFLFAIANSCALPSPGEVIVTAVPAVACAFVVAIWKVSSVTTIANTCVGSSASIDPCLYIIGVDPTPTKVDPGVYINSSALLKKWSLTVNTPVDWLRVVVSSGLMVLAKIGVVFDLSIKSVLLILSPFIARYCEVLKSSIEFPNNKDGGSLIKSALV